MREYPGDDVARRAFDVMMRRGWGVRKPTVGSLKWYVFTTDGGMLDCGSFPDPFTALIAADEWSEANRVKP